MCIIDREQVAPFQQMGRLSFADEHAAASDNTVQQVIFPHGIAVGVARHAVLLPAGDGVDIPKSLIED